MQPSTALWITRYAVLVLMSFIVACHGSGDTGSDDYSGDAGTGEPYDWFVQPVAGVILGTSMSPQPGMEATVALYSLADDPTVQAVLVNAGAAPDRSGAEPPNVTGFDHNTVAPTQRLVITGERIRTEDVAISAWFEIDGAVGVAVPAIAITARVMTYMIATDATVRAIQESWRTTAPVRMRSM